MAKKVLVTMSDECHSVLKQYAAFVGKTMSEVMYDFARQEIHNHQMLCKRVTAIRNNQDVDKRTQKACWGFRCYRCKHADRCRVGMHEGLFELDPMYKSSIKDPEDSRHLIYDHCCNQVFNTVKQEYV